MDQMTPEQRHKAMSRIRSKDTSIEIILRKALWHRGYRYRKNYKGLPGTPDIALTKQRIAVFCDSEFFHGKDWDELKLRLENGSNSIYWIRKITRNMERDRETEHALAFRDWTVLRFWGEDIKKHTEKNHGLSVSRLYIASRTRSVWSSVRTITRGSVKEESLIAFLRRKRRKCILGK